MVRNVKFASLTFPMFKIIYHFSLTRFNEFNSVLLIALLETDDLLIARAVLFCIV